MKKTIYKLNHQFFEGFCGGAGRHAAIHNNGLTIDKTAVVGCQKVDQCRHFLRFENTLLRDGCLFSCQHKFTTFLLRQWPINSGWAYAVNSDQI